MVAPGPPPPPSLAPLRWGGVKGARHLNDGSREPAAPVPVMVLDGIPLRKGPRPQPPPLGALFALVSEADGVKRLELVVEVHLFSRGGTRHNEERRKTKRVAHKGEPEGALACSLHVFDDTPEGSAVSSRCHNEKISTPPTSLVSLPSPEPRLRRSRRPRTFCGTPPRLPWQRALGRGAVRPRCRPRRRSRAPRCSRPPPRCCTVHPHTHARPGTATTPVGWRRRKTHRQEV